MPALSTKVVIPVSPETQAKARGPQRCSWGPEMLLQPPALMTPCKYIQCMWETNNSLPLSPHPSTAVQTPTSQRSHSTCRKGTMPRTGAALAALLSGWGGGMGPAFTHLEGHCSPSTKGVPSPCRFPGGLCWRVKQPKALLGPAAGPLGLLSVKAVCNTCRQVQLVYFHLNRLKPYPKKWKTWDAEVKGHKYSHCSTAGWQARDIWNRLPLWSQLTELLQSKLLLVVGQEGECAFQNQLKHHPSLGKCTCKLWETAGRAAQQSLRRALHCRSEHVCVCACTCVEICGVDGREQRDSSFRPIVPLSNIKVFRTLLRKLLYHILKISQSGWEIVAFLKEAVHQNKAIPSQWVATTNFWQWPIHY